MWRKFGIKTLDWYIFRKFIGTFIYAILLINVIVIVFDISEKIDDFIQSKAPFSQIMLVYYLNFIPYFVNLFSPLFTFIAVIFFTAKMASQTEIVAILSNGVSFRRILVPYIVGSVLIALLSFYLSNFVIPPANAVRYNFEKKYLKSINRISDLYIHFQVSPGYFVNVESYNKYFGTGYRFNLERIENSRLRYKLSAETFRYDTINFSWHFDNYFIRIIDEDKGEKIITGNHLDTLLGINEDDLSTRKKNIDVMNFSELNDFIEQEKIRGSENINYYLLEKHRRIAFPFATVILTLIGVSLSSRKVRGGIGVHIGIGITLSFAFIMFMQVSNTFSLNANLPPAIAVWIPNIIFGVLAVFLLKIAHK